MLISQKMLLIHNASIFFVILFQNVKKKDSLLINKLLKKVTFSRWLWFFSDCVPVSCLGNKAGIPWNHSETRQRS